MAAVILGAILVTAVYDRFRSNAADLGEMAAPVLERRSLGVTEDGVASQLHESHGGREPLADERGQFMNDGVRVFEFVARKKRCIARNVG